MTSGGMNLTQDAFALRSIQPSAAVVHLMGDGTSADDLHLIALLRSGDEAAFASLIDRYASTMMRLAMIYVTPWAVAEEVVQETWMAILEGLNRFEGRSSLKTWMFRILTNCAKTRAHREGRSVPFSSLFDEDSDSAEPAVDLDRFLPADHQWAGHWVSFPSKWEAMPEERLLSQETYTHIERAIEALPPHQREVIVLRDIEGWTSDEVCNTLCISEGNQRVLLHRARSKVRSVLEHYFQEE
jgi:RNA polymerase sigma-70 factor, ECF subfamily